MTTAEVARPRLSVASTYLEYGSNTLNVGHNEQPRQAVAMFTPEEVLEVALAAYERGYAAGAAQTARQHWNSPAVAEPMRRERIAADVSAMRERAAAAHQNRGLPVGYDYKGGPVDWETGMPAGSGCAWLRRKRLQSLEAAA